MYYGTELKKFFLKLNEIRMSLGPLDKVNYVMEDFIIPRSQYDRSSIVCGALSKTRNYYAYGDAEGKIVVYNLVTREIAREIKVMRNQNKTKSIVPIPKSGISGLLL
jgi:hypothetical protein